MNFQDIGRLPTPGDNAAIATKRLEAGTEYTFDDRVQTLSHSILEGHRFAISPIHEGEYLYSWGMPFGSALRNIEPGEYLCNSGMLRALELRNLSFTVPKAPNFKDYREAVELDERAFQPGTQVAPHAQQANFEGYARSGGRGVGTRNDIVILGTTSLTASFARSLERRFKSAASNFANIDGITAVTHTEGGGSRRPNNLELVLRTLSGFMVHPNVGAVLAVDFGTEMITNKMLEAYLREHDYPIDDVLHRFYSVKKNYVAALDEAETMIRDWLVPVNETERTFQPLSELRIALQCGGSDAFSGVSGNPLAGWTARELIRHGGSAGLAETDELIGAEAYILANTRDLDTARRFLETISRFKERIAWHGHSAEGNPTGGNKLRGLYNIALKSIGAARKKDPDVRLDHVIAYGQPMTGPGFYFMDSPGNDLESIAGQVASGCNMIYFITGNGSITNFPFVPTIKFITTTGRFNLLSGDMDVNAGRYQDGTPLEELGKETFSYTVDVASGMRSIGERAGHSQVSIWRDWQLTDGSRLDDLQALPGPGGVPISITAQETSDVRFRALPTSRGFATEQLGLIVPTSLCASQIALRIAVQLNAADKPPAVSRFVALPHTEGCGTSSGENEELYTRTLVGHLLHPFVREALLLEHGCEKTHNDLFRHVLEKYGLDPERFGYASIQMDGGIENVVAKVEHWFAEKLATEPGGERQNVGAEAMSLGLLSVRPVSATVARALARVVAAIAGRGGTVVIPQNASVLDSSEFLQSLGLAESPSPSLDYGAVADRPGLHVMATTTGHIVETLTGLGGCGVQIMLAHVLDTPMQGHPMIPLLQVTTGDTTAHLFHGDMDYVIPATDQHSGTVADTLLHLVCDTASHTYAPGLWAAGNTDFQFTRGMLGVSL
jgi:altronate dehydratase